MIYSISNGMKPMTTDGKNNLEVGRILKWCGYGDKSIVVVKNLGISESFPHYGATYLTICLETRKEQRQQAYGLRWIKDGNYHKEGIGVYITDEIMAADEVLTLWEEGQAQVKLEEVAKIEKANFKARERQELTSKYSHLECSEGSKKSSHALGAANIKKELKKAFPSIKFSVKSDSFSGGDSIDIDWNDGPTVEQVEKITAKYQEGSFDGMTDCYDYNSDNQFPSLFGGAKFVQEQRSVSGDNYTAVAVEWGFKEAKYNPNTGDVEGVDRDTSDSIKREARKKDYLTANDNNNKIPPVS